MFKIANSMFFLIEDCYEFKIYCYLCSKFDEQNNSARCSYKQISKDTKISVARVKRSIKGLCTKQYVVKNKFYDKKVMRNEYGINYVELD